MRLTVLGCAGTFARADSPCSSYLIEHDGFRLVLDVGNGALGPLQQAIGLFDVDAIVLSHLHADHCLDLVSYSYARRYSPAAPHPLLPVYGPAGTEARISAAYEEPPPGGLGDVFEFRRLAPGHRRIGPFDVAVARTNHPVECYAVRVSAAGRALTYSADTGESAAVVELARDSDLFLCEAAFADDRRNPSGLHLSGRQAGEHATRAGARRLLLTHLVAWNDPARSLAEASAAYAGPVELARSGSTYQV